MKELEIKQDMVDLIDLFKTFFKTKMIFFCKACSSLRKYFKLLMLRNGGVRIQILLLWNTEMGQKWSLEPHFRFFFRKQYTLCLKFKNCFKKTLRTCSRSWDNCCFREANMIDHGKTLKSRPTHWTIPKIAIGHKTPTTDRLYSQTHVQDTDQTPLLN